MAAKRTILSFQRNAKLFSAPATIVSVHPWSGLEEDNRQLFKEGRDGDFAIITDQTIFHPQGGGQPSDVGSMTMQSPQRTFNVLSARMDAIRDGQVLHFGRLESSDTASSDLGNIFKPGDTITQEIDVEKRLYYSRLHTAGHVLGSAVRHLLEKEIEGFDELKASHFPDSASCEFQGLIEGKWKEPIQKKVDEFVAAKLPVEVDFWDEDDFRKHGLERLIPDPSLAAPGEKFRIVKITGGELYPCGGTHVDTTDLCGETKVKKISRSKGKSRVSYSVDLKA